VEIFGIDAWLAWFLIGMGLLIVEVAIAFTFYAAPIALGAFAASIVALAGGELELQLVALILGAIGSLAFLRPIVRQHLLPPDESKASNVQSLLGRRAIALQRVDIDSGTVRLGDDVWSARTESEDVVIAEGARVEVVAVRGVYAYVKPMESTEPEPEVPEVSEAGRENDR
jgi:membrane protein implicated in regulation of membrane protease activity